MPDPDADRDLEAAKSGDTEALERALYQHFDAVEQHLRANWPQRLAAAFDVEDVLQATLISAFTDIGKFRGQNHTSLKAWLRTLAEHRLQDMIRHHERKKRGGDVRRVPLEAGSESNAHESVARLIDELVAEDLRASQVARRAEAQRALRIAVAALPPDQREAIERCSLQGRPLAEVAEAMGRSTAAVRGLIQRGKTALAAALGRASLWLSRG